MTYNFNFKNILYMVKQLKFIHITKTAGTSIEDIGSTNNIKWGRFHTKYRSIYKKYINYEPWHCIFKYLPISLKYKYDWFMVVRNPYTRIISEFHYDLLRCINNLYIYDKKMFNHFIQLKIISRLKEGSHYTEQHLYYDNDKNIKIHVLKFENIKEDFNQLMRQYNLNIKLNIHVNKQKIKKFTVKDLNETSINLIKKIYKKDFEMFGYSMSINDV